MLDCKRAIKEMDCTGDCCGMVPIPQAIWNSFRSEACVDPDEVILTVVDNMPVAFPITDDGNCVFLHREQRNCVIYTYRPLICRMYGESQDERLQCPYYDLAGKRRPRAERRRFMRRQDSRVIQDIRDIRRRVLKEGEGI